MATSSIPTKRIMRATKPKITHISDLVRDPIKAAPSYLVGFEGIMYGADPECCIYSVDRDEIVSSIPILQHDKHDPIDLGDGIKLYADNVLAEMSFPPSSTHTEFIERLRTAFQRAHDHMGPDYRLVPQASYVYADAQLMPGFRVDPTEIGCTPSYDCYSVQPKDMVPFADGLRSGSFHIHIGHPKVTGFEERIRAIKVLDIILGCASVLFDKDKTGKARHLHYGTRGEHRPTSYGLEYRVLSPFALRSPVLVKLALDLVDYSLSRLNNSDSLIRSVSLDLLTSAINDCNPKAARQILIKAKLPSSLLARIVKDYHWPDLVESWGIQIPVAA